MLWIAMGVTALSFLCCILTGLGVWFDLVLSWILIQFAAANHALGIFEGKSTRADENLIEDPQDSGTALVEIEIWQRGGLTGVDRGLICLSEGRVLFSGHRSSFALANAEVNSLSVKRDASDLKFRLVRRPDAEVRIRTLNRLGLAHERAAVWVITSIQDFLRDHDEVSPDSELPPLSMDPSLDFGRVWWRLSKSMSRLPLAVGLGWFLVSQLTWRNLFSDVGAIAVVIGLGLLVTALIFSVLLTIWTLQPILEIVRTVRISRIFRMRA